MRKQAPGTQNRQLAKAAAAEQAKLKNPMGVAQASRENDRCCWNPKRKTQNRVSHQTTTVEPPKVPTPCHPSLSGPSEPDRSCSPLGERTPLPPATSARPAILPFAPPWTARSSLSHTMLQQLLMLSATRMPCGAPLGRPRREDGSKGGRRRPASLDADVVVSRWEPFGVAWMCWLRNTI